MNIKYWNGFTKRKNSTKQPNNSDATTVNVRLKDNTSVLNPTFELTTPNLLMNYLQWEGRYYFVNNTTLRNNNVYEVSCSDDPLATHKSIIGNYTAMVERSASSYDPMLYDVEISKKEDAGTITKANTSLGLSGSGCYVVRVVGRGSIQSYALSENEFIQLVAKAFTDTADYPVATGALLTGDIVKALFNPFQYVVSVMWFPFSSIFTLSSGRIFLGWYDSEINANFLSNYTKTLDVLVSKPAETYGDYRDYSNDWCTYQLYVPACGQVQIDASIMKNNNIYLHYAIDLITGVCTCQVSADNGLTDPSVIASLSGTFGVQVQIGQQGSIASSVIPGVASAGISAATGNYLGSAVSIGKTLGSALSPSVSVSGSQGTMASIKTWDYAVITKTIKNTADIPNKECGRPLYQNTKISNLSGFIRCANASIPLAGYEAEKEAINNYLNTGFYYE